MSLKTIWVIFALAMTLFLPAAHARPPRNSGPAYPAYYPAKVPIKVGILGPEHKLQTSYLLGPEYWKSLPSKTRYALNTWAKFCRYAQEHEGGSRSVCKTVHAEVGQL